MSSLNKINKALTRFEQENERQPTNEELSEMAQGSGPGPIRG